MGSDLGLPARWGQFDYCCDTIIAHTNVVALTLYIAHKNTRHL